MADRTAIDTIKGYFYQFDYSIKRLLDLKSETDTIVVEGIEDIDIHTATEETAVQCKYYSKTEYNHSVIAEPIRLMLTHYKGVKEGKNKRVNYVLYGCYKSGHNKLTVPITIDFIKDKFLTYTKNKNKYCHHEDLGINDNDLADFMSLLQININAVEYNVQVESILDLLKRHFKCSGFESEHYFYNNALHVMKRLATEVDVTKRRITKKEFLNLINNRKILFNLWFIQYKGKRKYLNELRKKFFTNLNSSPFARFFIIEVPKRSYIRSELKDLLMTISRKYSKLSKRESKPFCPFVCIYNLERQELIELKSELQKEGFIFKDGFDFNGAQFNPISLSKEANYSNQVQLKIMSDFVHLELTLKEIEKTKEIYQFYISTPLLNNDFKNIKQVNIQVEELVDIKEVI